MNKRFLKRIGITHVVNAAEGNSFGQVNTDENFYRQIGIRYIGLSLMDLAVANVAIHFDAVASFIDNALRSNGKGVLCIQILLYFSRWNRETIDTFII